MERPANGNQGRKYQKSTDSTQSVSQLTAIVRGGFREDKNKKLFKINQKHANWPSASYWNSRLCQFQLSHNELAILAIPSG